jgi:hypothetical protein
LEVEAVPRYATEREVEEIVQQKERTLIIRCLIDGLLLDAELQSHPPQLLVFDGDESFVLEAVEALFYEIVSATPEELLGLQRAYYRLLFCSADFEYEDSSRPIFV